MYRVSNRCFHMEKKTTKFEDMWNRYIILQRMRDHLKEQKSLQLHATVLETSLRGCDKCFLINSLNTVVCGVVLNDLNIRCNVNCSTVVQKGSQLLVDVLDVVPDCLKIKACFTDMYKDEEYVEYSKVL